MSGKRSRHRNTDGFQFQRGYQMKSTWRREFAESHEPVGLVAGWGRFPVLVAEALVSAKRPVVCVALKGLADPRLEFLCDHVQWHGVAKLGAHLRYFQRHGIRQVTFAGKLFKAELLFRGSVILSQLPDLECLRTFAPHFIWRRQDTRDDSLLNAATLAFARRSMEVVPATDFAPELLIKQGVLTSRSVSEGRWKDIQFGWSIAKAMGGWDVGQAITVCDGTVIAIEAVEGTDACIERTGELCKKGGWSLIKVAKPQQDMRFDVPTIGPQTVEKVAKAGGKVIAIEADMTIVVDALHTSKLADRLGVAIIAIHRNAIVGSDMAAGNLNDRTAA